MRLAVDPSPKISVRRVDAEVTRPLRRAILRPHQSLEESFLPGEDDPRTGWFAAFHASEVVGTAGVLPETMPDKPDGGWRLRAMATSRPGIGIGTALLDACLDHVRQADGRYVWCSARVPAHGFYLSHGFETVGEVYEPEDVGPHVNMWLTHGSRLDRPSGTAPKY